MDVKDKKILEELFINSRIPISILSKKVGVSREVAMYRIKKLQKSVIKEFYTIINYGSLGFRRHGVFMQLKGITSKKEKEFIEYLIKHDHVTYMSPIIGKWNLAFDVIVKDETQLREIILQLTAKIAPHIESYIVTGTGLDMENYPIKYVGKISQNMRVKKNKPIKYELDDIDKKILKLMAQNSRIEYQELSKKLKLAANTIKYRIKNMEKSGIILGYTIGIDHRTLDYELYNLQLKLNNTESSKFLAYIKNHQKTIYYYKHLGQENWDIDIGVIVKSSKEFREFMIELKNSFGELIKIHDMYLILENVKDDYAPEGVFT